MKIDRLIGILSIMLQKEKVTSVELAEKFEVSKRTILRDIDTLNMSGIPIVSEPGQGGGMSIMEGYKVDRTLLSSEDMQAILSGLKSLDSISGTSRYRQLMEKLSADDTASINADSHIIIDLSKWDKAYLADKIELIKKAMEEKRLISFQYYSPTGESVRKIEPYHLVFQWSSWYVWGYCKKRKDYRMFKLTRMTDLMMTKECCAKRNIPEYICDKSQHTDEEVKVTVRFDKTVKWRVIDECGTEKLKYDEKGNVLLTFTWSDVPSLFQFILSFDDKAEILKPTEYRKQFAEVCKKILSHYEK